MSSRNDEKEAELDAEAKQEVAGGMLDFRFRNHSKNFAIPAKISLCTNFHQASEISLA